LVTLTLEVPSVNVAPFRRFIVVSYVPPKPLAEMFTVTVAPPVPVMEPLPFSTFELKKKHELPLIFGVVGVKGVMVTDFIFTLPR
jgi:hypothetical protein